MNNSFTIKRTNSEDLNFQNLVALLDKDLKIRDGEDHFFYAQFNKIDSIKNVVILLSDNQTVACGAFKKYNDDSVEIKRMFVLEEFRGRGIALRVLNELETWAYELNFSECILETGFNQPEAIRLYQKAGYSKIPNYGQYENVDTSICMKKIIKDDEK